MDATKFFDNDLLNHYIQEDIIALINRKKLPANKLNLN